MVFCVILFIRAAPPGDSIMCAKGLFGTERRACMVQRNWDLVSAVSEGIVTVPCTVGWLVLVSVTKLLGVPLEHKLSSQHSCVQHEAQGGRECAAWLDT